MTAQQQLTPFFVCTGSVTTTMDINYTMHNSPMLEVIINFIPFNRPVFTVNMFVFISAKCSNPLYVLQISDSVRVVKESPRQEFDDTDTCCSSQFLIIRAYIYYNLLGEWRMGTGHIPNKL